jgi:hypothetical protein
MAKNGDINQQSTVCVLDCGCLCVCAAFPCFASISQKRRKRATPRRNLNEKGFYEQAQSFVSAAASAFTLCVGANARTKIGETSASAKCNG